MLYLCIQCFQDVVNFKKCVSKMCCLLIRCKTGKFSVLLRNSVSRFVSNAVTWMAIDLKIPRLDDFVLVVLCLFPRYLHRVIRQWSSWDSQGLACRTAPDR